MDEQNNKNEGDAPSSCPQCADYLAGWKRAQADYQNLKKETEQARTEFTKYANERLLHDLLPAIDQFSLVIKHQPDPSSLPVDQRKTWESWLTGVRAVQSHWDQLAASVGLERIPTDGTFDPALHDAAGEEEAEGAEPGTILKTINDGWRLHGKVLRPARVIVAK